MKKIVILFLTVMSLQIFGANYKVTGNNLTQKELKTNNSEIEKEIFETIGVNFIDWKVKNKLAKVQLHFPEKAYI